MKRTLGWILAFAGAAAAEQNLVIDANTSGNYDQLNGTNGNTQTSITVTDSTTINRLDGSSLNNLTSITMTLNESVMLTITDYAKLPYNNTWDKSYSTTINLAEGSSLVVQNVLYFGSRNTTSTGITQNTQLTFGQGASITAGTISTVAAPAGSNNVSTLLLTASFDAPTLTMLGDTARAGATASRSLITTTAGFENYSMTDVSLAPITALDDMGYTRVGVVDSLDQLEDGQYGLLYSGNVMSLVARTIPEPSVAALSLLLLVGLASRRRR